VMVMEKDQFFDVGKVDEIPVGKMKHVEVQGKEIVISNIGGIYLLNYCLFIRLVTKH
jgi:nitrite reductase/ring-hydroxylating ferredoxin subunit